MKRLLAVLGTVLVLSAPVHAERIKAQGNFDVAGYSGLAKDAQANAANQMTAALQKALGGQIEVQNLQVSQTSENGFGFDVRGEWRGPAPVREAAEAVRNAAVAAAGAVTVAKTSVASFRFEVDDARHKDDGKENVLRARIEPRLDLEVKDKLIEDLCVIDVPLVKVLERLGKTFPVTYVLHPGAVGRPVFVRLMGVTVDEALAAIADSAGLRIEKRDKYITFVNADAK